MERQFDIDEKNSKFIFLIVFLSLFLRFVALVPTYFNPDGIIMDGDSKSYEDSALALLETGHFAVSIDKLDKPQLIRTPGYPIFLLTVYSIFGKHRFAVAILQAFISFFTLLIIIRIANIVYNKRIVKFVALLLFFDILSIASSQYLMTETLFTFFIALSALCAVLASFYNRFIIYSIFIGILLSIATFIRPVSYYLIFPLLSCYIYIIKSKGYKLRNALCIALVGFIPWLLMIGGWQIRNYQVSGVREFSTIKNINLLFYRAAAIIVKRDNISFKEAQEKIQGELLKDYNQFNRNAEVEDNHQEQTKGLIDSIVRGENIPLSKPEMNDIFGKMATDIMLNNLSILIKVTLDGFLSFTFGPGIEFIKKWMDYNYIWQLLVGISLISLIFCYVGLLFWVWKIIKGSIKMQKYDILLWCYIIYFTVLSSGPEGYSRFRIVIMPIMFLYGGYGLALMFRKE